MQERNKGSWSKSPCFKDGCDNPAIAKKMCNKHVQEAYRDEKKGPGRKRFGVYRWYTSNEGYVQIRLNGKTVGQHRMVMELMLGRELLPGENVHHKNGVRNDNRPENLELWVRSQPSGQRPEDLISWAKEILTRYDPEALA
jgi:hypothetical protein